MAASTDPTSTPAVTPPPPGTSPQQTNVMSWEKLQALGEKALLSIEKAAQEQDRMKEAVSSLYKESQELDIKSRNLPKPVGVLTIFFWGYIAGVLTCIALGTLYWLSRKVIVKIGGCTVN